MDRCPARHGGLLRCVQQGAARTGILIEEKVGLPTSCFGDTRHFVTGVTVVEEIPLAPGVTVPASTPAPPESPPAAPQGR